MQSKLSAFALLLASVCAPSALSQDAAGWPGSMYGSLSGRTILQSPTLQYRGDVVTFKDPRDGKYYVAFEGNRAGTENEFGANANGGYYSSFIVNAEDRATVAAIYSALTAGQRFRIQYYYDPETFFNRRVMWITSFMLEK